MKKLLVVTPLLLSLLALAGCGSSQSTNDAQPTPNMEPATQETARAAATTPADKKMVPEKKHAMDEAEHSKMKTGSKADPKQDEVAKPPPAAQIIKRKTVPSTKPVPATPHDEASTKTEADAHAGHDMKDM